MEDLTPDLAARLGTEVTTLCACWLFTRGDGERFGATDHDRIVSIAGVDYLPVAGLDTISLGGDASLAPGRATANGALSFAFISDADLDAGRWDGATVDVWRVDWRNPETRLRVWSGRLAEITRQGARFSAELVSLKAGFERPIGRVYQRTCDADIGDARCGVVLDDDRFRAHGEVVAVLGPGRIRATVVGAFATGWFSGGALRWTSGAQAGLAARVRRHAGDDIELQAADTTAIAVRDGFVVTAGCDKSLATCRTRFGNVINFRGFPFMPGPETVLRAPRAAGGRR